MVATTDGSRPGRLRCPDPVYEILKVERWTFGKAMDHLSALKMQREQLAGMKRVNRPMREQIDETIARVDEAITVTGTEVTASNARLKALETECFGSGHER